MDNFLPRHSPIMERGRLRCEATDRVRPATPEESVRQRVLHWLIHDKGWSKDNLRLEHVYAWVGDPNRRSVRPDIELLDGNGDVVIVVECKREEVPLGQHVDRQAKDYALKAGAKWIWTTNGNNHHFMKKTGEVWESISSLEPLAVIADPPVVDLEFPENIDDEKALVRYWRTLGDPQFMEKGGDYDRAFLLDAHRVLFGVKRCLPYSHGGVHLLEDRGSRWHLFGNRSGGKYHTRYADFIAATQGTVVVASIAVSRWEPSGLRLCVGITKRSRAHHALQLDTSNCEWDEERKSWAVYHDGAMSQVAKRDVLEAVRESGAGIWIDLYDDGKEWIHLGELPHASTADWTNSRELLANLIHYAIIRSNLREAVSSR